MGVKIKASERVGRWKRRVKRTWVQGREVERRIDVKKGGENLGSSVRLGPD